MALDSGTDSLRARVGSVYGSPNTHFAIGGLKFAGGAVWDASQLVAEANRGTNGDDVLFDVLDADYLAGGSGNDRLIGGFGNDLLVGGAGDDIYEGGDGVNTIRIDLGGGHDVVYASTGQTTIEFGAGIAPSSIRFEHGPLVGGSYSYDWFVRLGDGSSVHFPGASTLHRMPKQMRFADGTVWNSDDILAHALAGGEGADQILGFQESGDAISGGAGDDILWGAAARMYSTAVPAATRWKRSAEQRPAR